MPTFPASEGHSPLAGSTSPNPGAGWANPFFFAELHDGFDRLAYFHRQNAGDPDPECKAHAVLIRAHRDPEAEDLAYGPWSVSNFGPPRYCEDVVLYRAFFDPEEEARQLGAKEYLSARREEARAETSRLFAEVEKAWGSTPPPSKEEVAIATADQPVDEEIRSLLFKVRPGLYHWTLPDRSTSLGLLEHLGGPYFQDLTDPARKVYFFPRVARQISEEVEPVESVESEEPEEPSLLDQLREFARCAVGAVPKERIFSSVGLVFRPWLRQKLGDIHRHGFLSDEEGYEAALDRLTDSALPAVLNFFPLDELWWLFVYSELRHDAKYVEQEPSGPREESDPWNGFINSDPLAVIRWPCEASRELLKRLNVEAVRAGGVGSPALPVSSGGKRGRPSTGPKRVADTPEYLRTIEMWSANPGLHNSVIAEKVSALGKPVSEKDVRMYVARHRSRIASKRPAA